MESALASSPPFSFERGLGRTLPENMSVSEGEHVRLEETDAFTLYWAITDSQRCAFPVYSKANLLYKHV